LGKQSVGFYSFVIVNNLDHCVCVCVCVGSGPPPHERVLCHFFTNKKKTSPSLSPSREKVSHTTTTHISIFSIISQQNKKLSRWLFKNLVLIASPFFFFITFCFLKPIEIQTSGWIMNIILF
jgi:hypothetical protein